ncbi:hypothetical protein J7547_08015 [Wohlfahrtiimonas chitiniclastica]|uniref:Uncharacterized protein n=1 Tax=Wohlfahrtiimonas chitiniclastica TaxID=400946 RepID=A0AB35C1Y1_9GAMM|nr:hypothetical protein [Wohlfahrtiimonas chitiniclastica]MBS7824448.1 hypothetical protein [Wohlfahrtiimonas chitiniclastica]MBS7840765.1 hypothetical protein [Wohlfahrtiimonas chitiniclastica]
MDISNIEQEYWDALERLKNGETKIVDTKSTRFRFTKDSVGREAGRGKGYVRYERYPKLCDAIAEAEKKRANNIPEGNSQTSKLDREIRLKKEAKAKYSQLKEEYDKLMTDYINVMRRNLELETGLADTKDMKLKLIVNNGKLV